MFIHRFLTDTTTQLECLTSTRDMDQKMEIQLCKSGDKTSWILETTSDATSVPGVQRLTLSAQPSFGADQLFQMLLEKHSLSQFLSTGSKTPRMILNSGITTIQTCKS